MPSATLLFPGLADFSAANLIDIYVTSSEIPPQEPDWELPHAPIGSSNISISSCFERNGHTPRDDSSTGNCGGNVYAKLLGG